MINTFSSDIEGHVETYGEDPNVGQDKDQDSFGLSSVQLRRLANKWILVAIGGPDLEVGCERIKDVLKIEPAKAEKEAIKAADLFFANKKITDEQERILETGWPKMFKDVFAEIFQQDANPETTQKAKEFHWTQWEKAIPRDAQGKIDPRLLDKEKKAFEAYWRELQRVMQKLYIPGKSWGLKYGEFYHKDVGWYS